MNFDGRDVSVILRRNSRARQIILRVDSKTGDAIVTLPLRASEREAISVVQKKSNWLISRLEAMPPRILFENGSLIPLLGQNYLICHDPTLSEVAVKIDKQLCMGGRSEHLTRRLRDWLRKEAKSEIQSRAFVMAARLERKIGRITVRDTKTRWGSCSPNGDLSFCWRLIMTPAWVLDYVVAHEVSHLRHMNHSPEFWKTVESLGVRIRDAKAWLSSNADQIQRYG